ncbi:MAG: formyltransferase family protein [Eubacteriales bacterium]
MRVVIVTIKSWNILNAEKIMKKYSTGIEWMLISNKEDFNVNVLSKFNPDYILFPHWSWIIPKEIYETYECLVFHMTDLPFGRGGSPLQNLIIRGIENTKISAILVSKELDAGGIYLKNDLSLNGTADEIFIRASKIIFFEMIPLIIKGDIKPIEQSGEVVHFKRRNPSDSEIDSSISSMEEFYNHIRMLDGQGYPKAFIKFGKYRLEFSRASFKGDRIISDIIITEVEK